MPFDDEQKAELGTILAAQIAEALRGDDFKTAIGGVVDARVGAALKTVKLDEKIKAVNDTVAELKTKVEAEPEEKPADKKNTGGDNIEDSPAYKRILTEQADLKRQLQATEDARVKAEEARKTELLHSATRTALGASGVARVPHAMALLEKQGLLFLGDGEAPSLKLTRAWGDETLPVDKGIAEWLKTEDGKAFLPATNVQGTGEGGGKRPNSAPRRDGKVDWGALRGSVANGLADLELSDD